MPETVEKVEKPKLVHPSLRPRRKPKKLSDKQRRTVVRTAKLVHLKDRTTEGVTKEDAVLIQVPIEPQFNNLGSRDLNAPLRFYLDKKGMLWPHEYDDKKYPGIYCAVLNCWDWATVSHTPDGSERCVEHEAMWRAGMLRYQDPASPRGEKDLETLIAEIDAWVVK
jgi:hypothetical protein